jgi:putative transposase
VSFPDPHAGLVIRYAYDLERKLRDFRDYYNSVRVHHALHGITPVTRARPESRTPASLSAYRWRRHCRGLYQLPAAA